MEILTLIFIITCMVGCAGLLYSEKRDLKWGRWGFKITASTAFILVALTLADVSSAFSNWMIVGFFFSFFGDMFLIKNSRNIYFKVGIASFALAHIAFLIAFKTIGSFGLLFYVTTALAVCLMLISYRWLRFNLDSEYRFLVPIYIVIIGSMCAFSGYAWEGSFRNGTILGAFLFAFSDLFVARARFIKTDFKNKLIGLPMYYLAQLFLALSLDW